MKPLFQVILIFLGAIIITPVVFVFMALWFNFLIKLVEQWGLVA